MDSRDYYNKKLKSFETFVGRWQNASAKIWEHQVSHSHLVIRLELPGVKGNLHIIGIEPEYYSGKFQWDNCNIRIEFNRNVFKIMDMVHGMELQCHDVEIKENCKPVF
jgi:hypothetical protein